MIEGATARLESGADIGGGAAASAVGQMLSGAASEEQCAAFLLALARKGETGSELAGMLEKISEFAVYAGPVPAGTIDMCGTGGDGRRTFNVSTAASFAAAAAGAGVAKHGNRSSSGGVGSADVLEHFGCDLGSGPAEVRGLLERHGVCFMFAPRFHPAMGRVAQARRRLGCRTAFNLLGPLSNPAGVRDQLVGVPGPGHMRSMASVLAGRGAARAMVVCSADGTDELTTSSSNSVALLRDGSVSESVVRPEDVGLRRSDPGDLAVSGVREAAAALAGALRGDGPRGAVETVAFNAAGGLVVAGLADSLADGVEAALESVRGGAAWRKFEGFVADAGDRARLEGL